VLSNKQLSGCHIMYKETIQAKKVQAKKIQAIKAYARSFRDVGVDGQ